MKKIHTLTAIAALSLTSMAHAGLITMSDITGLWGLPNDQGVTSKFYLTTIDGIDTTITFSSNTAGNLYAGVDAGNGIIGIIGGAGAIAGIESRASEFLTITLTPTTASGITYTVNSGTIFGAGANANAPEFAFTDVGDTTTYASATVGATISSGLLAFSSAPSGLDSVSFTLRQTIQTADLTEGAFLSDFTVTAIPEPSTYALLAGCFALTSIMVRRRRR